MFASWHGSALAGACCVGSTTTLPTRLGVCEHAAVGLAAGWEHGTGVWDRRGRAVGSTLSEDAVAAELLAAVRWDRKGQLGVALPARVTWKSAGELAEVGGGVGDVRVIGTWQPIDGSGPIPALAGGVRVPTGRHASEQPLAADVTGQRGAAALVDVGVDATDGPWPWTVHADAEIGQITRLGGTATVGRAIGSDWSVSGSARHVAALTGTHRTTLGLSAVVGRRLRWRGWASATADVPLPYAGRSTPRQVGVGVGAAVIR